ANIRRDVVERVVQELNGYSNHAHETNAYGNNSGQLPQSSSSMMLSNNQTGGGGGGGGGMKRPSRDRGDDTEEKDDGDPGKRRKLNSGAIHSSILRSRFACPFYKRN